MSAAAVVPLGSAASAAAALRVPVVLLVPAVPVPHEPELPAALLVPVVPVPVAHKPQRPPPALPLLGQVPPGLLPNLLSSPLPQVVVESEVPVRLQGRRSFSAAMARSSPPTGKPT